ncbi:GNAT family N-acetyltransferase [Sphingorhabdus arenilitoris]|uniref:GNAT family N-acetyltransferase n=1 Tax=Sphingorhabdus arenilitoris TaxID=1490041 RepID=A0ABV8RGE4_9SPHN
MRQQVQQRQRKLADIYPPSLALRLMDTKDIDQADFRSAWNVLAENASEPNPFCEYWFLRPAFRAFDTHDHVSLFTLWDNESGPKPKLVGLVPIGREVQYGRWPLPHLQNWLHPNAFLGVPLIHRAYERLFWEGLLAHLDRHGGHNIFFHINGVPIGGPVQSALADVCAAQGRKMELVHSQERAMLQSALSPSQYYEAAMRSKKRKELRRQKNRLSEHGELTFRRSSDDVALDQWVEEFLALEKRGWKGEEGSALDCAEETRLLFQQSLAGAAAYGRLERLDLRLNGEPIAMLVNFLCPPGSFSFKTAFDEKYARYSPGVLLQIENLDLLLLSDVDWCDSCAAEGHPMIDSVWTERRAIGRYSVAIGGMARRAIFGLLLQAETAKMERKGQM